MKKSKVVLLPLDERPCNFNFPKMIYDGTDISVVQPDSLGEKKKPADVKKIEQFLKEQCRDADYAVLSLDTLLYGGLLPSRMHNESQEEILKRFELLKEIKQANDKIKIYAFQCIMRCPHYSSDDEEPDYYGICGAEIHKLGIARHKKSLGLECEFDEEELLKKIKEEFLVDYENRRRFNITQNIKALELVYEGVIDFLIIPQDDSTPYGYTAMDQKLVRERLQTLGLSHKVFIYPGADEIEMTLMSRVANDLAGRTPKVFVRYASVNGHNVIPLCEDRPLGETIKYHLMAAGCIQVHSDEKPDFVLAINSPPFDMLLYYDQPADNRAYSIERSLPEFVFAVDNYIKCGIPVTIGDNAYLNGSELALVNSLNKMERLFDLSGYAGWNTSSNTIGTSVAQAVRNLYWEKNNEFKKFLVLRYLEDAVYDSVVRDKVTKEELPKFGMNYYDVCEKQGIASKIIEEKLKENAKIYLSSIYKHIQIDSVSMPWNRMFEAEISVTYLP